MPVVCGSDEVDGHVFDDRHVLRSEAGPETSEIVVEDDIEDPVQAIFDAPMGADGGGECAGVELC